MEDKQSASGDLTEEPTAAEAAPEENPAAETAVESDETPDSTESDDAATESTPEPTEEPAKAASWWSRSKAAVLIGVPAALFVIAGGFAGATVQPYLADRAAVETKLDIARTAANAITTLWTYTPEDMDKLPDRAAKYLSGSFEEQYRKYVDAIVPTNKQAKVTNNTQVVGAAVESLRGNEATAIVYTNSTSTSPLSKNIPSIQYLSYRLELKRDGGDWRMTKMTTVTSLDLTPKL